MEYYPKCQTQQLAPVISLCLGNGPYKETLQHHLDLANVSGKIWDSSMLKNRLLSTKYIINYHDSEDQVYKHISLHKVKVAGEHSQLSPFNAKSDLFPNGILSCKWFEKYTAELPFAIVCVYELGAQSDDETLGATLASARAKYQDVGVRFVAIIVSSATSADEETERLAFLRQSSGLASQSGLFVLNSNPDSLDQECGVLTSTLFNNLKTSATDFYSAIEHKVRQRYRKYYTLPTVKLDTSVSLDPKFLEIRNLIKQAMLSQLMHPHNVEPSLSIMELAYENLIGLLKEVLHLFASKSVSTHDVNLYKQFRNLLDIIAVHLIRGYISIEEPVAALRKHDAHIASVLDAISPISHVDQGIWLSIQYEWLAELMGYVPESVLSDLHKVTKGKNKSNQNSVTYYGGITFHDKFFSKVVTELSLLYVKGARNLDPTKLSDSPLAYLQIFSQENDVREYKVKLLQAAKKVLNHKSRASGESSQPTQTLNSLIDWLIGEEYMACGQYLSAIKHYNYSLQEQGDKPWTAVSEVISTKIMLALVKLEDSEEFLRQVASLSILKPHHPIDLSLPEINLGQSTYELEVNDGQFLSMDVFLYEESFKEETHVLDSIVVQLVVENSFDFSLLKKLIPECEVTISAQQIDIEFVGRETAVLKSGGSKIQDIQSCDIHLELEHLTDLDDLTKLKIIQLKDVLSEPGSYEVAKITAQLEVRVTSPEVSVLLRHTETHVPELKIINSKLVYQHSDRGLLTRPVRVGLREPSKLTVLPYRPDIGLKMLFPFATIIVGEKLDISFEISHKKSSAKALNLNAVSLRAQTRVLEEAVEIETLPVQTNWESLKDDEPLSIQDVIDSEEVSSSKTLWMSIRKPPGTFSTENKLQVVLDITLLVTETNGVESVYELESYMLPIVVEPFSNKLNVSPKCNLDGVLEMPNPFVLGINSSKDHSMPLPSRTWRADISIIDQMELVHSEDIQITSSTIALKSKNAEIIVEPIGQTVLENGQAQQLFVTKSKHRFTDRNVTVVASATFEWRRKDKSHTNLFETNEWEVAIPLQDPRVLLQVEDKGDRKMHLTYTIENPTPRIFTFTTSLVTAEVALQGTNWDFDDSANLSSLNQSAFPVLPFSQYVLVYRGTFEVDEQTQAVQLPQLQVYDVNYKVSLPTIPLDDVIIADKAALYIKDKRT